jgi:hypothetical protein
MCEVWATVKDVARAPRPPSQAAVFMVTDRAYQEGPAYISFVLMSEPCGMHCSAFRSLETWHIAFARLTKLEDSLVGQLRR